MQSTKLTINDYNIKNSNNINKAIFNLHDESAYSCC